MTKIVRVDATVLEADLPDPWDFGIEPYATSTAVLVEIESESGAIGWGEAIARKSPGTTKYLIEDLLAPIVRGRSSDELGRIWLEGVNTLRRWGHHRGFLMEAISGVDIALWDLRAKETQTSIGAFLPFGSRPTIPVYASSIYFQPTVEQAASKAVDVVGEGFRDVKIKIGHRTEQGGLRRDIETVRAIRDAVGDDVSLMLDANGAYSLAEASRLVRALSDADITWLEEPFPPDDVPGYRALAQTSPIPLAAGESEFSIFGFRDLVTTNAIQYAQPDIARCGGFTGALQVLNLCYAYNINVCPHTGFSGGINNLASIYLASSLPSLMPLEFMIIGNPLRDIFTTELPEVSGGNLTVPSGIGLGFEIDAEKIARFSR